MIQQIQIDAEFGGFKPNRTEVFSRVLNQFAPFGPKYVAGVPDKNGVC